MTNIKKLVQTVNYILRKYNYNLNYTKLIKILYIAEKEAYKNWDTPILDDKLCSMDKGPVLGNLYDLIKGTCHDHDDQCFWNSMFYKSGYDLKSLVEDKMPTDELSRRELKTLDEIDSKFHDYSFSQMIEYVHNSELFPEWEKPEGSSLPIDMKLFLKSLNREDQEIERILRENNQINKEIDYLTSCCG